MSETTKVTTPKYGKESLLHSKYFSILEKDIIASLVSDDESLTISEVTDRIRKFKMRRVN